MADTFATRSASRILPQNPPPNKTLMQERRKYPRITKSLPLKLFRSDGNIVTQTVNLSCNGAYFSVDKDMPVMTKLEITILLPGKPIRCKGIVVRSEKSSSSRAKNAYNIAVFFHDIKENERHKLKGYINQHISLSNPNNA